jgi:hypothetical protein
MQPDGHDARARALLKSMPALVARTPQLHPLEFITAASFPGQDVAAWTASDRDGFAAFLLHVTERCRAGDQRYDVPAEKLLSRADALSVNRVEAAAGWDVIRRNAKPDDHWLPAAMGMPAQQSPLVREVLEAFSQVPVHSVEEADVLSCQHLMGSVIPQFRAIRQLLPGARFWELLGKPYSANPTAVEALRRDGFEVNEESCQLPSGRRSYGFGSFAARHKALARTSVARFFVESERSGRRANAPIIVIDDGGTLVAAVAARAVKIGCNRPIICVEQTQRGLSAARSVIKSPRRPAGGFLMVNVAQSISKLVLEAALIADSVLSTTLAWLDYAAERRIGVKPAPLTLGLIGYGSVGESISSATRSLASGSVGARLRSPVVYDRNPNRLAAARRDGYDIARSLPELLSRSGVVIAAVGGATINEKNVAGLQEGLLLLSASSGDAEFRGIRTLPWKQDPVLASEKSTMTPFDDVHGLIRAELPAGGSVTVANGGFPVNFDGSLDPIEPERIQLTRALMVAGVLQAVDLAGGAHPELKPGDTAELVLDPKLDSFVERRYGELSSGSRGND